ncbi:hypothetical protein V7103_19660 [Neobacillus drentensis]|jgi:hypothetical protein|uniref:hypothetical protein n=1 Tax=Neobacillus drentensis TaxID=220684 RepID=UPI002FFE1DB3
MAMSKVEARNFLESEEVKNSIWNYTTFAFNHVLVYFVQQPELGYIRVKSEAEINELALTDFFELFYTDDDIFSKLYPKQTLFGEASLSKHFRSAIGFIVVSAVENYMEVENNHLWNHEEELFEACFEVAGKRYYELMTHNDLYTMTRDYPDRELEIMRFFS